RDSPRTAKARNTHPSSRARRGRTGEWFPATLLVYPDARAERCPVVQPLGEGDRHVDAAVTARLAEVAVPVDAVEGHPVVGEVHHPGDVGDVPALVVGAGVHVFLVEFD